MKRIVIELTEDDYKTLLTVKNLLGISWRDFIIAGGIWWSNGLNIEEYLKSLRKLKSKFTEQKN